MRALYGVLWSVILAAGLHAEPRYYVEVINDAPSSIQAVQVAVAGSGRWETLQVGAPIHGGGDSVTLGLRNEGGCLRDFFVAFTDGRTMTQRFDICRYGGFRTLFYWQHAVPRGSTGERRGDAKCDGAHDGDGQAGACRADAVRVDARNETP